MKYLVKTLVCADGVVGLNGWQYLLTDDNKTMLFDSKSAAKTFLLDGGCSQEFIDEQVEIEESDGL